MRDIQKISGRVSLHREYSKRLNGEGGTDDDVGKKEYNEL